jgi:hypothetical protein
MPWVWRTDRNVPAAARLVELMPRFRSDIARSKVGSYGAQRPIAWRITRKKLPLRIFFTSCSL